jgi:hypothetical protein
MKNETGVNCTGTRSTGETIERGKPHRGVEGLTILDCTGGCARPEVEDNETECGRWFLEILGYGTEDERI